MKKTSRFAFLATLTLVAGLLAVQSPARGDTVSEAKGSAFGVQAAPLPIGPDPQVEAAVPPGPDQTAADSILEVPADPLATSFTAHVEADASIESKIEARLAGALEEAGVTNTMWNARGFAIVEDLGAVTQQVLADVIESEALAACVKGKVEYASVARVVNLSVGGQGVEILGPTPNQVVFDQGGIRIVLWETNWDGEKGIEGEEDVLFVNALHITGPGGIDVIASHSEASATCGGPAPPPPGDKAECEDKRDNDGDGEIDFPDDPGCKSPKDDDERDTECTDGIDNDGDGVIDFPEDPGCKSPQDDNERNAPCFDSRGAAVPKACGRSHRR